MQAVQTSGKLGARKYFSTIKSEANSVTSVVVAILGRSGLMHDRNRRNWPDRAGDRSCSYCLTKHSPAASSSSSVLSTQLLTLI